MEMAGARHTVINDEVVGEIYGSQDARVFDTIRGMLSARLHERLTTFLDATSVNDGVRSEYVKMASSFGVKSTILIFDEGVDECIRRNLSREFRVHEDVIRNFHDQMDTQSIFPFKYVSAADSVTMTHNHIDGTNLDVVGDIHGLIHNLRSLIGKLGYIETARGLEHPRGRKLLLLGDFIDRGQDSLDVLRWVMKAVSSGHYAIVGNHEKKLIRFWNTLKDKKVAVRISSSSAETADMLMRIDRSEAESMISFLVGLPDYYVMEKEKIAFCHANVDSFDPESTPSTVLNYGSPKKSLSGVNSDISYYNSWKNRAGDSRLNQYQLVRGHITSMDENDAIFSLEDNQAFAGRLVAMRMDKFIKHGKTFKAFKKSVVYEKCSFDYKDFCKTRRSLEKSMLDLVDKKLVEVQKDPSTGLMLFKYHRRVFYEHLWDSHPLLIKARGLVMDMSGRIAQHPFDKIFNYKIENNAGLDLRPDTMVRYVEKMNGFLSAVTMHPYIKNQLLVTTTGSFDSRFVDLAMKSLREYGLSRVFRALSGRDVTLLFEIVSREDPHIIQYADSDCKPWLIGVRGLGFSDKCWSEPDVDALADTYGFARPRGGVATMRDVIKSNRTSQNEGVMVRDIDSGEYICKLKTPSYLTIKFVGRMTDDNVKHMFQSPESFKRMVDEEFYYVVDSLTSSMDVNDYMAMPRSERVQLISSIADDCTVLEGMKM